jgi:hypothetical protein
MVTLRGEGVAPLTERDAELACIERNLSRASRGRGGVTVVSGPAGIGKTALLAAAREMAVSSDMRVLRARGAELEGEFGFGVVRQLFEPLLATAAPEERADWLEGPAGLAARLLNLRGVGAAGDGIPESATRRSRSCTGSTGCARTSRPLNRCVSSSTTPTGPTPRPCASRPSSSPGSRSFRSRWSWRRGRQKEPHGAPSSPGS